MALPPPRHHITASACGGLEGKLAPTRRSGFTLLELLIACAIALTLLGICMYLFGQTSTLTRASLGRAELALTAQTFDARLRDDTRYMLGPNRDPAETGGCLVIVPALRQGFIPLSNGQMSANRIQLRSDQLVFFSKRDPANPRPWVSLLPEDGNTPPQNTSYEARLWYGAVRDANLTGDGTSQDISRQAHLWKVGRDLKLILKTTAGEIDATVQSDKDTTPGGPTASPATPGGLINLKNMAVSAAWTDQAYVAKLIGENPAGTAIPNDNANYTNQPTITPQIDLKALQHGQGIENGIQLSDLAEAHTRLLENCSEIVIQWGGDLDKDGQIDFYPANHPLAGSIIWYPEELHASAPKDATTKTRLSGALLAKYNLIAANPWTKAFPAGFAPALGVWPNGRFGAAPASGAWTDRFQFDYGETDNAPNQTAATPKVPAPYVFRFDDDQYRLVRFGFRQDGSIYRNKHDGTLLPAQTWSNTASYAANSLVWHAGNNYVNGAAVAAPVAPDVNPPPPAAPWTAVPQRHWTPYPPTPAVATTNPTPAQLYTGAAPAGPYPLSAPTGTVGAAGLNFGDVLGDRDIPTTGQPGANGAPCRETPPAWPLWAGSESAQAIVHYPTAADPLYYALPTIVAGDIPGTSPNWAPIPQPIPDYAGAGTAYPPGSFVHNGGKIYCNTADIPGGAATAYVAGNAYALNENVTYGGVSYYATVDIDALASMPPWADDATYAAGSFVSHDGVGYRASSAIATPPTIDPETGNPYDPPLTTPEPPHDPWQVVGPPDASPLWVPNTLTGNPAWQEVSPPPYGYRIRVSQTGRILSKTSPATATASAPAVAAADTVDAQTAVAATGAEPVFTDGLIPAGSPAMNPYALMTSDFGPGNNHTVTYADLWAEYFKPVNTPALQGTPADWRNPQSDWPKLLRIRLRLHDAHGKVTSYSDEALINGRDDDGDGVVDNPEEGRSSGIWYEFVIAVPYPMDPTPRQH